MANCRKTLITPLPIDESFAYLADFSNAAEWDPGVVEAEKLDAGPVAPGTRFRVVSRFLGQDVELVYSAVQVDAPARIVFEGVTDSGLRSIDTLTFEKVGGGTEITYDAQLVLPGLLYLADLPLHLVFQWVGRQAIDGLAKTLRRRAAASESAHRDA
jgi:hypothetical protein